MEGCTIQNNSNRNLDHLSQMINHFFPYAQEKLGFFKPVMVSFQSDEENASKILGRTAHYNPDDFSIALYVDERHPKDILRSFSHELVHHAQNCNGDFESTGNLGPGYAQENEAMRNAELDAYKRGNIIFRDFEDLIKKGDIEIEIDFEKAGEPKMSLKEWKNNELNGLLMEKWGYKVQKEEQEIFAPNHYCAHHVRENISGREGRCVDHNWNEQLQEVTAYEVDFGDNDIRTLRVEDLTILEASLPEGHAGHMARKEDHEEEDVNEQNENDREEDAEPGRELAKAKPAKTVPKQSAQQRAKEKKWSVQRESSALEELAPPPDPDKPRPPFKDPRQPNLPPSGKEPFKDPRKPNLPPGGKEPFKDPRKPNLPPRPEYDLKEQDLDELVRFNELAGLKERTAADDERVEDMYSGDIDPSMLDTSDLPEDPIVVQGVDAPGSREIFRPMLTTAQRVKYGYDNPFDSGLDPFAEPRGPHAPEPYAKELGPPPDDSWRQRETEPIGGPIPLPIYGDDDEIEAEGRPWRNMEEHLSEGPEDAFAEMERETAKLDAEKSSAPAVKRSPGPGPSAPAPKTGADSAFDKMDTAVSDAQKKYGKNFGTVTTSTRTYKESLTIDQARDVAQRIFERLSKEIK